MLKSNHISLQFTHTTVGERKIKPCRNSNKMADNAERERIFKRFDANGDGKISSSELGDTLNGLGSVSGDETKRMMSEIDTDGDGFISFKEFTDFADANPDLIKKVAAKFN